VRSELTEARRLVVKLGTGVLTDASRRPDPAQLEQLVAQIAAQRSAGRQVAVVTSGAVGAGMGVLGFERRPDELDELQACAAIGQSRLMATYEKLFAHFGLSVGQVLLTHEDLLDQQRYQNARNTLNTLLDRGVVPIINENDAVSFTELKFGDNDKLSALVACMIEAHLLVLLTTVDGVIERYGQPDARRLPLIERIDDSVQALAGGTTNATAVGGMVTKIEAARIATSSGIPLAIACGRKADVLKRLLAGEDEGTLFLPSAQKLSERKRRIAFYRHARGTLFVDDGARQALRQQNRSLLAPGVIRSRGEFSAGELVRICDRDGVEFARGLSAIGSTALRDSHRQPGVEVVNRNHLVLL
jgi:glutamate 5-kinase